MFECVLCFSINLFCGIALARSLDQQLGGIHVPGFGDVPRFVDVVEPVHRSVDAIVQLTLLFAKTRTRIWLLDLVPIVGVDLVLIVGVDLGLIGIQFHATARSALEACLADRAKSRPTA